MAAEPQKRMHLDGLNLNLLVAFDALAEAGTLTEAAANLSLTQPALSGALRQLREVYNDPLILFEGGRRRLTPLGEQLAPMVRQILVAARETRKVRATFDPATAQGQVEIRTADWIELTFLKDALGPIAAAAKSVELAVRSRPPRPSAAEFRENCDLVLTSRRLASPDYPGEPLFADRFACIAWSGNRRLGELDQQAFATLDHAGLAGEPGGLTPAERAFGEMAVRPRLAIRTEVHATLPHFVIGTDLIAVTSWRFAQQSARTLPLRVLPLPFDVPPLDVVMQWQPYREADPLIAWVRDQLRTQALTLPLLEV